MSLCRHADERRLKVFIGRRVVKTFQPPWKINNQQCGFFLFWKMRTCHQLKEHVWQSWNMQIYKHTQRHKHLVIRATLTIFRRPCQLDRLHYGSMSGEMFIDLFTEPPPSCYSCHTTLQMWIITSWNLMCCMLARMSVPKSETIIPCEESKAMFFFKFIHCLQSHCMWHRCIATDLLKVLCPIIAIFEKKKVASIYVRHNGRVEEQYHGVCMC